MGSIGRLKGRCLRTLFDFWSGKTLPEKDTIGKYAVVTGRLLWKQGLLDEEECLDWLEGAFLALPHKAFSDRLSHDFGELMRVTGKMVEAVCRNNGYQAAPEESGQKLEAVITYCQQQGIVIHDRSTWPNLPETSQWLSDFGKGEVFRFSYDQRRVLKEEVHALLHTEEIAATYEAAGRIISFVKRCPGRELAWQLVPYLCADLDVRWHKNKCCALLRALVRLGFLYVRVEKMWRGKDKALNRARSYGIGAVLVEKAVVLRDAAQDGKLITVLKKDIDERNDRGPSLMPEGLVNVLAGRQEFLDLARYLMEIAEKGPERARQLRPAASLFAPPPLPDYERDLDYAALIRSLDRQSFKRGEAIYVRVCANCHGTREQPGSLPTSLRFAEGKFKNGSDPYRMYQTLTHGFGLMTARKGGRQFYLISPCHLIRDRLFSHFINQLGASSRGVGRSVSSNSPRRRRVAAFSSLRQPGPLARHALFEGGEVPPLTGFRPLPTSSLRNRAGRNL